jgi:hypothetical protein
MPFQLQSFYRAEEDEMKAVSDDWVRIFKMAVADYEYFKFCK